LSARAWQDIRRARKLGADGQGGGVEIHGIKLWFRAASTLPATSPFLVGTTSTTSSAHVRNSPVGLSGSPRREATGDEQPQRSARQQRQIARAVTNNKATAFFKRLVFRRWQAAIKEWRRQQRQQQQQQQRQQQQQQQQQQRQQQQQQSSPQEQQEGRAADANVPAPASPKAWHLRAAGLLPTSTPVAAMEQEVDGARAPKRAHETPTKPGMPYAAAAYRANAAAALAMLPATAKPSEGDQFVFGAQTPPPKTKALRCLQPALDASAGGETCGETQAQAMHSLDLALAAYVSEGRARDADHDCAW
jgi:hypothetical protein